MWFANNHSYTGRKPSGFLPGFDIVPANREISERWLAGCSEAAWGNFKVSFGFRSEPRTSLTLSEKVECHDLFRWLRPSH